MSWFSLHKRNLCAVLMLGWGNNKGYSVNVPTKTMAYEADSPIITSYAIFIVIFLYFH